MPVAAGFVQSDLCSDAVSDLGVGLPPDLDDPWLGDPWADVCWGEDDGFRGDTVPPLCTLGAAPGPGLVGLLDRVDVAALGAGGLVDVVAAWERVVSWARAGQAAVVAELAGRAEMLPRSTASGIGSLNPVSITAAELAAALPLTKAQAENLVGESVQLVQDFPGTLAALQGGRLDVRRARTIVDELGSLEPEVRRQVEPAIVADPTADPGAADTGAANVEADVVGDAVGGVDSAVLRRRLKGAVHGLAPVTVAERGVRARARRFVRVTPAQDGMAWLEALLPAEDAIAVKSTLDAAARELKRRDAAGGDVRARSADQRRADALAMLAWASLSTKRLGGHRCECPSVFGVALGTQQGRPVSVNVTVPFTTLTGLGDAPGELAGYGPIPAPVARRLAGAGVWRWLGHDPVTGALLSYGRTRYVPPAELVEFILARDAECRMPGCHRPARGCELDHTIPYPVGVTAAANLGALCSFHHRLKHHTRWSVTQPEPGVFVWTSPAGRTTTVCPADLRAQRHHRNATADQHPTANPDPPGDHPPDHRSDHPPDLPPF